jgi:hypothetical protein
MGTSISQGSSRTSIWKPLHACYSNKVISEQNVIKEVWKAADNPNESVRWSSEIKSDIIYKCYESVKNSKSAFEAIKKFNETINKEKNNSIAAELAKRSIQHAYSEKNRTAAWTTKLIKEISNYVISRDTSGFVGEKYRSKTVKELVNFKSSLNKELTRKLSNIETRKIDSKKQWNNFIDKTISNLKK